MSQTAQTLALVGATLGAVVITFLGTAFLQHRQATRDDRIRREQTARETRVRLEQNVAELLAGVQDLVTSVRAIRHSHERRTKRIYYLRLAAMVMRDYPIPETWGELADPSRLKSLFGTAVEADRYQLDEARTIAIDLATTVATRASRYLAVAALTTLGEDREIADAVRNLTPKVTGVIEGITARKGEFERRSSDLQKALEDFRGRRQVPWQHQVDPSRVNWPVRTPSVTTIRICAVTRTSSASCQRACWSSDSA